jgi:hypothetical protein
VSERPEAPLGYEAPILQGVWQRIQSFGVLRLWGQCWAALWIGVGLWTLTYLGFRWLVLPFVCWIVGHGVLAWLTQWNDRWDEMAMAQWGRGYKDRYDAG